MWVMVVDDDPQVRRVARRGLEQQGLEVAEAEDAATALSMAGELDVDVAILDRQLPGMSGLELIGELRRLAPSVHIIMLTGAGAEADRVLGLVSGADDYMVKPFSARELAARVVSARRRQVMLTQPVADLASGDAELAADVSTVGVASQPVVVLQSERIVEVNSTALLLLGAQRPEQLVGRDVFTLIDAESVTQVRSRYDRVSVSEGWSGPELLVLTGVDGRRCRVVASSTPIEWEGAAASRVSLWPQSEPLVKAEGAGGGPAVGEDPELAAEIRRGVTDREFVVHYQPIVRLSDAAVVGVEALVRWQHPQRGLLAPVAFMDVAESSGAIVELGTFVLNEARRQWAAWQAAGYDIYISVNLSGSQLSDPNLPSLIAASQMPEGQLWLEVTETSLVQDLAQAGETLTQVTDLGPKVAIDDFGTGWASMTYLREFPVHALKIDRSFVHGVGTSSVDTAIVMSVLSLGRELGLRVFAEGIETPEQHAKLRELGCEFGQGYLFGRPVPSDELGL